MNNNFRATMAVALATTVVVALGVVLAACGEEEASHSAVVRIVVENPLSVARGDALVEIPLLQLQTAVPDADFADYLVMDGDRELPSQLEDPDRDGSADKLLFSADLVAGEQKSYTLRYAKGERANRQYPLRAYAELAERVGGELQNNRYVGGAFKPVDFQRAPASHKPQDMLYKYEGPGWESDKVAYRLYFDSRNATDIFGKTTSDIVLPLIGQQEDNYHQMLDWGMDILKVGESLGIGAIGMRGTDDNRVHRVEQVADYSAAVLQQGPLRAQVRMQYGDWQVEESTYQLRGDFSIDAGSRMTHHQVSVSGDPQNLVTGIVRHAAAEVFQAENSSGAWGYLASYGKQSFIDDELGMAIVYRRNQLQEISTDAHSELVVMRPHKGQLEYYFLAAWKQEPGGIQSRAEFVRYLDDSLARLNNPVQVSVVVN